MTFAEFQNIDLRVGRIIAAERVPESEKLVKLEVDLGEDHSTSSDGSPQADSTSSPQADSTSSPQADSTSSPQAGSGLGKRQIIAGIGKVYEPENLLQKEIAIVANLEPRKFTLRQSSGQVVLESQGMLLAAHGGEGEPILLMPDKDAPPGSKIT